MTTPNTNAQLPITRDWIGLRRATTVDAEKLALAIFSQRMTKRESGRHPEPLYSVYEFGGSETATPIRVFSRNFSPFPIKDGIYESEA